eukprot:Opistho-2@76862
MHKEMSSSKSKSRRADAMGGGGGGSSFGSAFGGSAFGNGTEDAKTSTKEKEKSSRDRDRDDKEAKSSRDKDRDRERERDRDKDSKRSKDDKDSRHKDTREDGDHRRSSRKEEDGGRGRGEKDKDGDRKKSSRTDDDAKDRGRDRDHRGDKERDGERDRDTDKERRSRKDDGDRRDRDKDRERSERDRGRDGEREKDGDRHRSRKDDDEHDRDGRRDKDRDDRRDKDRKRDGKDSERSSDRDKDRKRDEKDADGKDKNRKKSSSSSSNKDTAHGGDDEREEEIRRRERELMARLVLEEKKGKGSSSNAKASSTQKADAVDEESMPKDEYEEDFEEYQEDFEEFEDNDESEGESNAPNYGRAKTNADRGRHRDGSDDDDARTDEPEDEPDEDEEASRIAEDPVALKAAMNRNRDLIEVMRATDAENARVLQSPLVAKIRGASPGSGRTSGGGRDRDASEEVDDDGDEGTKPRRRFLDFSKAKDNAKVERDVVAAQTRGVRGREILRLIDLDFTTFNLFELSPVSEYELYIKSFGKKDSTQASTQTRDDDNDQDTQTEPVTMRDRWVQNPPEDLDGWGGTEDDTYQRHIDKYERLAKMDASRLSDFLKRAGQVGETIMEENTVDQTPQTKTFKSTIPLSVDYLQLSSSISFLAGRPVIDAQFSPTQPQLLLTSFGAYPNPLRTSDVNRDLGFVTLWNLNEPSRPQKILVCESVPTRVCFSPVKASMAFAGTVDGSVVAWDLREPSTMHKTHTIGGVDYVFRSPTYSTDGITDHKGADGNLDPCHRSPIAAITAILNGSGGRGEAAMSVSSSPTAFQIASLGEDGVLNIWVVLEVDKTDPNGSEVDLGLRPGGKIKLVRSSSVTVMHPSPRRDILFTDIRGLSLAFFPEDPNHYVVGSDIGVAIHGVRVGGKATPKYWSSSAPSFATGFAVDPFAMGSDVTDVDFSPFDASLFLLGHSSGRLSLHTTTTSDPIAVWEMGNVSVRLIRWSRSRPCVFFVLDDSSRLAAFDLLEDEFAPIMEENFGDKKKRVQKSNSNSKRRSSRASDSEDDDDRSSQVPVVSHPVASFALSCDPSSWEASADVAIPGQRRSPEIVIAFESGVVEVHRLCGKLLEIKRDEAAKLAAFANCSHV